MSRFVFREYLLAGGVLGSAVLAAQVSAQPVTIPNFSFVAVGWTAGGGQADFLAVSGSPRPNRPDPVHPYVPNNTGKQPTYRIADMSNPNLKQWAKDIMKKDNDEVLAGKIAFMPRSACAAAGVPAYMLYGGGNIYFLQTPKQVVMIFDGDQQVRHIYLDEPHSANPKPSWYGESVGHYEGDELVIDTIGLNTKTFVDNYRTPHTEKLHVTERWKKIEDGNRLEVLITIDDPVTFNQPWQVIQHYRRVEHSMDEQVCSENNFHLFDYGIPVADKPDF
jgi:hypothetical protein